MTDVWKIVFLSILTIGMWLIGYICGKLEGYTDEFNNIGKFDISSNPDRVQHYLDVVPRRKTR